jgi:GxxExxY protein
MFAQSIQEKVLVEIKSIERLAPVHFKQVITHLRLTNLKPGLLVNFQEELIKNGTKRVIFGL